MSEVDEIKARLEHAADLEPCDDWLDRIERMLRAHANSRRNLRLYDVSTVGKRIQTAREVLGLSRTQLAARLGLPFSTPGRWERGQTDLPADKLPALAMCLGVSRSWLLEGGPNGGPDIPHQVMRRVKDPTWWQNRKRLQERAAARERLLQLQAQFKRNQ